VTRTASTGEVAVELAPHPRSGQIAREAVDALADTLHPETMAKLRLLVTELVVAALGPAETHSLVLTVRVEGDAVRAAIARAEEGARLERPHSWNLFLVTRIADRWDADARGLWFEVAARQRP
jgi:hypothetical protein